MGDDEKPMQEDDVMVTAVRPFNSLRENVNANICIGKDTDIASKGWAIAYSPFGMGYVANLKDVIAPIEKFQEFYDRYNSRNTNDIGIDFVLEVTDYIVSMNLHTVFWLEHNLEYSRLSDNNCAFLYDSIKFAMTGRRDMSLYVRLQLTDYYESLAELPTYVDKREEFRKECAQVIGGRDLLSRWLSHDGGFEDMLYTYHTFFSRVNLVV